MKQVCLAAYLYGWWEWWGGVCMGGMERVSKYDWACRPKGGRRDCNRNRPVDDGRLFMFILVARSATIRS